MVGADGFAGLPMVGPPQAWHVTTKEFYRIICWRWIGFRDSRPISLKVDPKKINRIHWISARIETPKILYFFSNVKILKNGTSKMKRVNRTNLNNGRWWLKLSWQSGCFQYQRITVQIKPVAKFYNEHLIELCFNSGVGILVEFIVFFCKRINEWNR